MKDELFSELAASIHEGGAIIGGDQPASRFLTISPPDIKKIRIGFGLTQEQFAALLGISVRTLRNWEQNRRVPGVPGRVLLQVAMKHPEAVLDVAGTKPAWHPHQEAGVMENHNFNPYNQTEGLVFILDRRILISGFL
jgi:putative transcriptional regulator